MTTPTGPTSAPLSVSTDRAPTPITITSVNYSKLVNLGNYENEKIAAWATVEDGQTPDVVLDGLRTWVDEQAGKRGGLRDDLSELERSIQDLQWKKRQLTEEMREMGTLWKRQRAFLEKIGLELPGSVHGANDDMPF
jgi:hypothetical protein